MWESMWPRNGRERNERLRNEPRVCKAVFATIHRRLLPAGPDIRALRPSGRNCFRTPRGNRALPTKRSRNLPPPRRADSNGACYIAATAESPAGSDSASADEPRVASTEGTGAVKPRGCRKNPTVATGAIIEKLKSKEPLSNIGKSELQKLGEELACKRRIRRKKPAATNYVSRRPTDEDAEREADKGLPQALDLLATDFEVAAAPADEPSVAGSEGTGRPELNKMDAGRRKKPTVTEGPIIEKIKPKIGGPERKEQRVCPKNPPKQKDPESSRSRGRSQCPRRRPLMERLSNTSHVEEQLATKKKGARMG